MVTPSNWSKMGIDSCVTLQPHLRKKTALDHVSLSLINPAQAKSSNYAALGNFDQLQCCKCTEIPSIPYLFPMMWLFWTSPGVGYHLNHLPTRAISSQRCSSSCKFANSNTSHCRARVESSCSAATIAGKTSRLYTWKQTWTLQFPAVRLQKGNSSFKGSWVIIQFIGCLW